TSLFSRQLPTVRHHLQGKYNTPPLPHRNRVTHAAYLGAAMSGRRKIDDGATSIDAAMNAVLANIGATIMAIDANETALLPCNRCKELQIIGWIKRQKLLHLLQTYVI